MWFQISDFAISHPGQSRAPPLHLYIRMNVRLYRIQIHIWPDRNQTLHTSPPWSGTDRRVCMGPQYFTFPTVSTYFVGSVCESRAAASSWRHTTTLLRYIRDAVRAGVTSRTFGCAMKTGRIERNVCVCKWKPDAMGRKWLMNCTCNYITFIQMIT